jgi:hypothetical protein
MTEASEPESKEALEKLLSICKLYKTKRKEDKEAIFSAIIVF